MQGTISYRPGPVIAVDFDGTLAFDSWPSLTNATPNKALIKWLGHMYTKHDAEIIIWSCRENYGGKKFEDRPYKNEAIQFCNRNGMQFPFSFNKNADEQDGEYEQKLVCRKVMADLYIDDHGFPFKFSSNRFIRWVQWKLVLLFLKISFG